MARRRTYSFPPERVSWEEHLGFLDRTWVPGQHVSIIAVSGGGKTVLVSKGLLPLWTEGRVLVLDIKGDDPELRIGKRVKEFPKFFDKLNLKDNPTPDWFRIVVPDSVEKGRQVAGEALIRAYREGKWLIVCDEVRALAEPKAPNLGLAAQLDRIWLRGRSKRITLIACTQAPRFVPSSFYEQAKHIYIGPALDGRSRDRLEEIGGDTDAIEAALDSLKLYEWVYVGPLTEEGRRRMEIVRVPYPNN